MTVPEHTLLAVAAAVAVVAAELAWLRTGVLTRRSYWLTVAVVVAVAAASDAALTRLPKPTFYFDRAEMLGLRFPLDVPVELLLQAWTVATLAVVASEARSMRVSGRGRPRSGRGRRGWWPRRR